jgi:hypothetical protein
VADVVKRLKGALQADYVVLGGGNAGLLKTLPAKARLGENSNAFLGGFRLWQNRSRFARGRFGSCTSTRPREAAGLLDPLSFFLPIRDNRNAN